MNFGIILIWNENHLSKTGTKLNNPKSFFKLQTKKLNKTSIVIVFLAFKPTSDAHKIEPKTM